MVFCLAGRWGLVFGGVFLVVSAWVFVGGGGILWVFKTLKGEGSVFFLVV